MVLINSEFEKALVSFMGIKELDIKTQNKYLEFYHKFSNIYPELTTKNVDSFLKNNRSSPPRAMIKNLLLAISRWDLPLETKEYVSKINIPKITGKTLKKIPKFITREEIDMLTRDIGTTNDMVKNRTMIMILVQFWGALRLEELIGLTFEDLMIDSYNPNNKFKTIRIRPESAKFKKEGLAYIPTNVYKMLSQWLKIRITNESKLNREIKTEQSIWGVGANRYRKLLDDLSYTVLGKKYNTHSLRHGRGTDLIKVDKWSIEEVKEYLRHQSISSTQIYVHLSSEDIKNKLEK